MRVKDKKSKLTASG